MSPASNTPITRRFRCWPWKHVWRPGGGLDYWDQHANPWPNRPIEKCENCRAWRWVR